MSPPLPFDDGSDSHFYFFSVHDSFLGSSERAHSDSDSMKSPTSPLDHAFWDPDHTLRLPSSLCGANKKSRVCGKVGLGILDSLGDDMKDSQKVFPLSDSKNILFGPQIRTLTRDSQNPPLSFTARNSDVLFEIGEAPLEPEHYRMFRACSLDSSISFAAPPATKLVGSSPQFVGGSSNSCKFSDPLSIGSLSTSEIELSEDYTCVTSHGPNPTKTHIYGDCILECHSNDLSHFVKNEREIRPPIFLSFCDCCGKKLEEGESMLQPGCRSREIMVDEELEKSENRACVDCFGSENGDELFDDEETVIGRSP